jgi:hypothetical protein
MIIKNLSKLLLVMALALSMHSALLASVEAHPGKTDGSGGHTCRTNCEQWGLDYEEYHYHNPDGSIRRVETKTYEESPVVQKQVESTIDQTKLPSSPIPTPSPSPLPSPEISPDPIIEPIEEENDDIAEADPNETEEVSENESGESSGVGGLIKLGAVTGLGYWGYKRLKGKKKVSPSSKKLENA